MDRKCSTFTSSSPDEFNNTEAITTIANNPHLFKIITPINVPRLRELLTSHLNQPLADSVAIGLYYGFWPFAHTHYGSYPTTLNDSGLPPKTPIQADFLRKQIQTEFEADHYSSMFGPDLLPGMYSTPILAVPNWSSGNSACVITRVTACSLSTQ